MERLSNRVVRIWSIRPLIAVIVVGAIALASCGSQSDSGSESATASTEEALAELGNAFGAVLWEARPERTAPFDFTEDHAKCIGSVFMETLVDEVGYDSVIDAGVTVEALEQGTPVLVDLIDNDHFDLLILDSHIECTDLMVALVAELSQKSGWNESSWLCVFDSLLAEEETRQLVAWGIFTVDDLGAALGELDPVTLSDLFFGCMTDEELTEILVDSLDPGLGVSEQSLSCLIGGMVAEESTRKAFKQWFVEDESLRDTLGNLSGEAATEEILSDLVDTCLTDDEQASLLGT